MNEKEWYKMLSKEVQRGIVKEKARINFLELFALCLATIIGIVLTAQAIIYGYDNFLRSVFALPELTIYQAYGIYIFIDLFSYGSNTEEETSKICIKRIVGPLMILSIFVLYNNFFL